MIRQHWDDFPTSEGKFLHKRRENRTSEISQVMKERTDPDKFAGNVYVIKFNDDLYQLLKMTL
jgi:hypothetical protein